MTKQERSPGGFCVTDTLLFTDELDQAMPVAAGVPYNPGIVLGLATGAA